MTEEHVKPRFGVSYERVVRTGRFETARISLWREWYVGEKTYDEAYEEVSKKVIEWTSKIIDTGIYSTSRAERRFEQRAELRKRLGGGAVG